MDIAERTLPLSDALDILDRTLSGKKLGCETVPTRTAIGRVLSREQRSGMDLPPFDKSAVDGYAIPVGEAVGPYRVVATVAAGQTAAAGLRTGEAVRIMTGAPVPLGTNRVVMQEDAIRCGDSVQLALRGPTNVCKQGEDVRHGDVVLPAGSRLGPLDAANLIGCGIADVEVFRRPRVAIIATGSEIVNDPAQLAPGKIMNANGPLLAGLCAAHGMEILSEVTVDDEPDAVGTAIRSALAADVVILSGGVSVGEFDYVLGALRCLGLQPLFSRLAVKPGKPTVFATFPPSLRPDGDENLRPTPLVFGLPGNPVAVFLMFHLFVLRAAARLTGTALGLPTLNRPLVGDFRRKHAERAEYLPAQLTADGRVSPAVYHGSAHLLALSQADGFFVVPQGTTELPAGASVEFLQMPERSR